MLSGAYPLTQWETTLPSTVGCECVPFPYSWQSTAYINECSSVYSLLPITASPRPLLHTHHCMRADTSKSDDDKVKPNLADIKLGLFREDIELHLLRRDTEQPEEGSGFVFHHIRFRYHH